jgi:hypothetical protein
MAGDDMAAKLVAHLQRAFQVETEALVPLALSSTRERLGRDVDGEPARALVDHRQAHTRTGDRSAEIYRRGVIAGGDAHPQVAAPLHFRDGTDVGDDAGEHGCQLRCRS